MSPDREGAGGARRSGDVTAVCGSGSGLAVLVMSAVVLSRCLEAAAAA
ncbi:hypothetical protein A2U01_0063880, partial [Trifolium medium]|nr:hypothetical protein [Trifolium medium]